MVMVSRCVVILADPSSLMRCKQTRRACDKAKEEPPTTPRIGESVVVDQDPLPTDRWWEAYAPSL